MTTTRKKRRQPSTGVFTTARGLLPLLLVALFLFAMPIFMLIVGAFRNSPPGQDPQWSFDAFIRTYTEVSTYETLLNSGILAVSATTLGVAIAVVLAFLVTRTTTPLRKLVTPSMVLVLALPPLFYGLSWGMLGNPAIGMINVWWTNLTAIEAPLFNTESWAGLILTTTLKNVAFGYLLLIGPFAALDRNLEEAAQVSGAGRLRTVLGIDLAVLSPAILGVTILAFVISLEAFEIPLLLGTRAGIDVFSTEIYGYIADQTPSDYGSASALSILLILLVILLVWIQWKVLGNRNFATVTGKSFRIEPWHIGGWRWVGTAFILIYLILAIVLPLIQLVVGSFQPVFGGGGEFTTASYERLFADPSNVQALLTTAIIAVAGGFAAMLLALLFVYAIAHNQSRMRRVLELVTWLPYAVPGVVLSLGILWTYVSIPGLRSLYGSVFLVALGLVVAVTPIAIRAIQPAVQQLSRELEEASRMSGASTWGTVLRIVVPIITPSFVSGWFVVGVVVSGNLAIPILLASSQRTPTVPMRVFTLYSEGRIPQAAALFVLFLGGILIGFIVLQILSVILRATLGKSKVTVLQADVATGHPSEEPELLGAQQARQT